jgi:hypothetical protein
MKGQVILTGDDNGKNLVDLQRIPLKEACICRYDVSEFNTDNVSWYKNGCIFLGPSTVTKHLKKGKSADSTFLEGFSKHRGRSRQTLALGARRAMRAAAALPALFSSIKLIVELMTSRVMIPTKSCQSGGFP